MGIIAVLGSLAVLPELFRKTRYSLEIKDSSQSLGTFPVDKEFRVVMGGTAKSLTLKHWLPAPKSRLIINFWATWCPPCLEEMPSLEYLNRRLNDSKDGSLPKMITISVDTAPEAVTALFPTLGLKPSFFVLHDPDGKFATTLGTTKFPETYLIDARGKILYKWLGPQDWLGTDVVERLRN